MNYKKGIILLVLTVFIFGMASVCAGDAAMAGGDQTPIELSQSDEISVADVDTAAQNDVIGDGESSLSDASVSVDKSTYELFVDDNDTIKATTNPEGLNITYSSSSDSVVTVDNGNIRAEGAGNAVITLSVGDGVTYARNSTDVNVVVSKIPTKITAPSITVVYNTKDYLVVTLTDEEGNLIGDSQIAINFDGKLNYLTNENGQFVVPTKALTPKSYKTVITFAGNTKYANSSTKVTVNVKKAAAQLIANSKIFKSTNKNKKYTAILRDNEGKILKGKTITLKLNGKTYKATTNGKGQATFNLKKLTKNSTATVTFSGDDCFKKVSKKANLVVKDVFKTICKGWKDKTIVKMIQSSLKDNGFYLTENGHYLMVDGIYWDYTVKAVKQFQKAKKLKVTGKVDEKTAKKLGII